MTANIENMMYVGEVPWHGVGTLVEGEVDSVTAIKLAGLDWDVETAPIVTNDHKRTGIDRWRVTRRVTDNLILGVVRKGYTPIQNREAFQLMDGIIGNKQATYHTAGSLEGGSKVFMLAKIPEPIQVGKGVGPTDDVERYILVANSHDGTRPLQAIFTPVRVVCSNTLNLALNLKGEEVPADLKLAPRVTVRHTPSSKTRIREAERTMKSALLYYKRFGDFAQFLYSKQVASQIVTNIISTVFPPNQKMEVTPTVAEHRAAVAGLFTDGKGHERIAGSAWALLNAFTEYADHSISLRKAKTPEDRSYSILMGGSKGLKNRATKVIAEAVL